MKRLQTLIYSLFGLIFLATSSCQKENDVYPRVEIKFPLSGGSYDFRDTLLLSVDVTKSDGHISINLMDGATVIPIANHLVYQQGSVREYELYFTDRYLESGKYEIRVLAFNGENRSSDFSELRYTELPLRFKGFLALSGDGSSATIASYDSIGDIRDIQLNGDYPYLAFNSFQQFITTAPIRSGKLTGFSFKNLTPIFTVNNPVNPGLRQYEQAFSHDKFIYVLENKGRIRAYNADGSIGRSYNVSSGYVPQRACIAEPGFLLSAQEDGKNTFKLFLMNPQNGSIQKQISISGRVADIAYAGQNTFVLTYPKNGDAVIGSYNTLANQFTEYGRISGATPLSLLRISDNEFLISTENKIFRFNPHLPQIPSVLYSFAAADMEYDALSGDTYFANGKNVLISAKGQSPYVVMAANDTIRQIELVYNK